jgi:hypothetical protein
MRRLGAVADALFEPIGRGAKPAHDEPAEADDEKLGAFAETLAGELSTYLIGYSKEQGYELPIRPHVRFLVDESLKLGRYEAFAELVDAEEMAHYLEMERPAPEAVPAIAAPATVAPPEIASIPTLVPGTEHPTTVLGIGAAGLATVTVPGVEHDIVLAKPRMTVGRLADCDISLSDANTSRTHAAFVRDDGGWRIEDLGSTNGTLLNGVTLTESRPLSNGDVVTIGTTELVFHESRV